MNIPLFFVSREENTSEGISFCGLQTASRNNYPNSPLLSLKWQAYDILRDFTGISDDQHIYAPLPNESVGNG
jgi:hypothetical protein